MKYGHGSDQDGRFRRDADAFLIYNDSFLLACFKELLLDGGPDGGAEVAEVLWRLLEMLTLPCIRTVFYSSNNLLSDMF